MSRSYLCGYIAFALAVVTWKFAEDGWWGPAVLVGTTAIMWALDAWWAQGSRVRR